MKRKSLHINFSWYTFQLSTHVKWTSIYSWTFILNQVLLEIVEVRGTNQGHEGEFSFSVSQRDHNDGLHNYAPKVKLRKAVNFQCEPTAELLLELVSSSCTSDSGHTAKTIGCTTISLANFLNSEQELSIDKWFELLPPAECSHTEPTSVRICLSYTPHFSVTFKLHVVSPNGAFPQSHGSVLDEAGNLILRISLMR